MQSTVKILGEDYAIECAECDTRRLEDLAKLLEQRLQGFSGDVSAMRRLVLTALGLIDEAQATSAALARARMEIERLTDMLVEEISVAMRQLGTPNMQALRALAIRHPGAWQF